MFEISLFGYTLCCKALVLCLFSIVLVVVVAAADDVLDSAVPYLSLNVPFLMHGFKKLSIFTLNSITGILSFIILLNSCYIDKVCYSSNRIYINLSYDTKTRGLIFLSLDLNEMCKRILQLDNSIRFAGVANMKGKVVAEAYREGLVPLLTKQETELSGLQAIVKMATRRALEEKKLGKTIYAFALYEKLKRATIPLMDEKDHILLISFELQADHENIILHKILPLVKDRRK